MKFNELDIMSLQNDFFHEPRDYEMSIRMLLLNDLRKHEAKYHKWNKFGRQGAET